MKTVWQGRMAETAAKYGENAPMATVCCNACRTCVTSNIIGLALAGIVGAGAAAAGVVRRSVAKPSQEGEGVPQRRRRLRRGSIATRNA